MVPRSPILVVGGTGLLGRHVVAWSVREFGTATATYLHTDPTELQLHDVEWLRCDLVDGAAVDAVITATQPQVIVNAAYRQGGPEAAAVCNDGAVAVARAAQKLGARLVHLSTDLVFDGRLGRHYREADPVSPISDYGRAKAEAERAIRGLEMNSVIVRTSLIYGEPWAPQEQLVSRALAGDDISFFTDEYRTPVEVRSLARAVGAMAASDETGVLHIAGDVRVDRLRFAQHLAELLDGDPSTLRGRASEPSDGPRPKDVSLDTSRAKSLGFGIAGPGSGR